jgi:hypothetical protein
MANEQIAKLSMQAALRTLDIQERAVERSISGSPERKSRGVSPTT